MFKRQLNVQLCRHIGRNLLNRSKFQRPKTALNFLKTNKRFYQTYDIKDRREPTKGLDVVLQEIRKERGDTHRITSLLDLQELIAALPPISVGSSSPNSINDKLRINLKDVDSCWKFFVSRTPEMTLELVQYRLEIDACLLNLAFAQAKISKEQLFLRFDKRCKYLQETFPRLGLKHNCKFLFQRFMLKCQFGDYSGVYARYQEMNTSYKKEYANELAAIVRVMLKNAHYFSRLDQSKKIASSNVNEKNWIMTLQLLESFSKTENLPDAEIFHDVMLVAANKDRIHMSEVYNEMKALDITPLNATFIVLLRKGFSPKIVLQDLETTYRHLLQGPESRNFFLQLIRCAHELGNFELGEKITAQLKSNTSNESENLDAYYWDTYMQLATKTNKIESCVQTFLDMLALSDSGFQPSSVFLESVAKATESSSNDNKNNYSFIAARILQIAYHKTLTRSPKFSTSILLGLRFKGLPTTEEEKGLVKIMKAIYLDTAIAYVNSGRVDVNSEIMVTLASSAADAGFVERGIEILEKCKTLNLSVDDAKFKKFWNAGFNTPTGKAQMNVHLCKLVQLMLDFNVKPQNIMIIAEAYLDRINSTGRKSIQDLLRISKI